MNNLEKIKSMNIDKMVNFINRLKTTYCQYKEIKNNCIGCCIEGLCDLSLSKTRQWLLKEVENE